AQSEYETALTQVINQQANQIHDLKERLENEMLARQEFLETQTLMANMEEEKNKKATEHLMNEIKYQQNKAKTYEEEVNRLQERIAIEREQIKLHQDD